MEFALIGQGRWEVSTGVEDSPHVDKVLGIHGEHDVREARERRGPKVRDFEFVGEPQRSDLRTTTEFPDPPLDGVDEVKGYLFASVLSVVLRRVFEIGRGERAKADGFVHCAGRSWSWTWRRSDAKKASSANGPGVELAPSKRRRRRRSRPWSEVKNDEAMTSVFPLVMAD